MESQASPPISAASQTLPIRFTGSGSEYFRIWIVNLLLTLLTLTLYAPFARARRLSYFYGNTMVGHDPMKFHGDPWKMLRGYLLVVFLWVTVWAFANFSTSLIWVPLLLLILVWPWLWRASLQFRMANTSWRGVRMAFVGDLTGAYLCMLPFCLPLLVFLLALPQLPARGEAVSQPVNPVLAGLLLASMLGLLVCLPWLVARVMRYMHSGYVFAQQRTRLELGGWAFYKLSFKSSGVVLLVLLLAMLLASGSAVLLDREVWKSQASVLGLVMVFYLAIPLVLNPYLTSRRQNLLWSNTRSSRLHFSTRLRFGPLFRLNAANWLLIALTLGLYWPFARVRTARLRLESVAVEIEGDVDQWQAKHRASGQGTLGDGAVDFLGIDVGL